MCYQHSVHPRTGELYFDLVALALRRELQWLIQANSTTMFIPMRDSWNSIERTTCSTANDFMIYYTHFMLPLQECRRLHVLLCRRILMSSITRSCTVLDQKQLQYNIWSFKGKMRQEQQPDYVLVSVLQEVTKQRLVNVSFTNAITNH